MRGGCRKSAASSMRNQRGERERAAPNSAAPPCFAIYTPQLPKKTEAQKHSGPARCSVLWGYARVVYPTREKALGLVLPALGAFFPCFFSRQANSPKTRSVGSARPPLGLRAAQGADGSILAKSPARRNRPPCSRFFVWGWPLPMRGSWTSAWPGRGAGGSHRGVYISE